MRERAEASTWKLWVLLEANRWVLTGALLAAVFAAMVVIGVLDPSPLQEAVATSDPVDTLFQAYVTAIVTGVTLVVTLNQLVLSQELGPVGNQRDQMEESLAFRRDVEDLLDEPASPAEPTTFLQALVEETCARAEALADAAADSPDAELRRRTRDYVDGLTENADAVTDRLDHAEFGTFDMLSAVLDFNYSWKLFQARRIRNEYAESATDEVDAAADDVVAAFDDIDEVLAFFGPAREHFKTLYFQWELVNLSRAMLYAALPALVVASAMVVYYDARALPGATLGISNDVLATSAAVTVASTPFVLLLSYILRIATVAKRTLAIGPFVLRGANRDGDSDGGSADD
jgi:hypothetical protein